MTLETRAAESSSGTGPERRSPDRGHIRFNRWDAAVAGLVLLAGLLLSVLTACGVRGHGRFVLVTPAGRRHFIAGIAGESTISAKGLLGPSVVKISPGGAKFSSSTCPLGICMAGGEISAPGDMAVCVPNGVAIFVEGDTEGEKIDGVTF